MREFASDPDTTVHPQTVISHFGSWNAAKRAAGLVPRRFTTREDLVRLLRELGEQLGRTPTARDLDENRASSRRSRSTGTRSARSRPRCARRVSTCRSARSGSTARWIRAPSWPQLGRLPKFADWTEARRGDETLLSEWQIYRMFEGRRGAWAAFQFLVQEQLVDEGVDVAPDGSLTQG